MKTLQYAVRFLLRSRSYTIINLLGLAFSLACSIILLRYINRETSVDTHCVDRERVIVPMRGINGNVNISTTYFCDTLYIPETKIINRTELTLYEERPIQYNEQQYNLNIALVDNNFLQMFRYPLVEGSLELSNPHQAIITQEYAKRMFGKESPVGKVLVYENSKIVGNQRSYENVNITISGVIKQPVCKTTLNFDILLSKELEEDAQGSIEFIQVLPGVDLEAVNKVSNVLRRFKLQSGAYSSIRQSYEFISLKDFYFNRPNNLTQEVFFTFGSSDYLNILFIVAVLLLFVGIMNFINLYMVYMMKRQKEYGIKKVYGLQKWPLFVQIWSENVLLAFWALMVAWLIIEITQIPIARLLGTEMAYSPFDLQLSLGFLLVLPLITSIYPYIRYQYMSPITSMRSIVTNRQSVVTRMLFLGVQYTVTFVLMVFSLYLNKHFRFMLNTPPGFRTERILEADLNPNKAFLGYASDWESKFKMEHLLQQRVNECPDIEMWMKGNSLIKGRAFQNTFYNDKEEATQMERMFINTSFLKMYDIKIVAGTLPDSIDSFGGGVVLLNQSAMKVLGYTRIEDAFIRSDSPWSNSIDKNGAKIEYGASLVPVTAVINDYYPGHLTQGVKPMAFILNKVGGYSTGDYQIQVKEGKEQAVLQYLKDIVREVYDTEEFEYKWMDEQVAKIYDEDRRVATIYTVFALIAIGVSCLGLFGISLFDIRQRYREIGIRKVNGAGMKDLYKLLFRKYFMVLGVSFIIAIPLAWYIIHSYTDAYVVKAPMGIGIFVIALLVVVFISVGTLWWQIRKAANINPSLVMKRE